MSLKGNFTLSSDLLASSNALTLSGSLFVVTEYFELWRQHNGHNICATHTTIDATCTQTGIKCAACGVCPVLASNSQCHFFARQIKILFGCERSLAVDPDEGR